MILYCFSPVCFLFRKKEKFARWQEHLVHFSVSYAMSWFYVSCQLLVTLCWKQHPAQPCGHSLLQSCVSTRINPACAGFSNAFVSTNHIQLAHSFLKYTQTTLYHVPAISKFSRHKISWVVCFPLHLPSKALAFL